MTSATLIPKIPLTTGLDAHELENIHQFIIDEKDPALSETFTPKVDSDLIESFQTEMFCTKVSNPTRESLCNSSASTCMSTTNLCQCSGSPIFQKSFHFQETSLERAQICSLSLLGEQSPPSSMILSQSLQDVTSRSRLFKDSCFAARVQETEGCIQEREDKNRINKDPEYQHIIPTLNTEGDNTCHFSFSNENTTVTYHRSNRFSTLIANEPLPQHRKSRFSIRIEESHKAHPMLYVGIVASEFKNRGVGYRPGWYFISTFNQQAYLNRLKSIDASSFAKKGQVISVLTDLNKGWISFEVEGNKVLEGKINLPRAKEQEFYPCVCLGELGGKVSFI